MKLVVITNEELKKELQASNAPTNVLYTESLEEAIHFHDANAIIDLLFVKDDTRIKKLATCLPKIIIVNCVEYTIDEIHSSFVRINAWPTLLQSSIVEAAGPLDKKETVQQIFASFGKTVEWTNDQPGFISARIISCIIREAKYAFDEGISSKEDIDKAMKLGTSYPYGPFEWYEKIGPSKVDALLARLAL
jgi:3-hydroxyacyl-CoA dehydrogenase